MKNINSTRVVAVLAAAAIAGTGAVALPAVGSADAPAQIAKKGKKKKPKKVSSKLYDNYFDPIQMTVKKNTKVNWKDLGATSHNVVLKKGPKGVKKKKFSSGTLGYGSKFSVVLKKKGTYDYVCTFHLGMEQTIKVKG